MQRVVAERVLNIDELAEYLRIAKSSLYKLAQQGKVPGKKVGRHWRFRKQAIDAWLECKPDAELKVARKVTSNDAE